MYVQASSRPINMLYSKFVCPTNMEVIDEKVVGRVRRS